MRPLILSLMLSAAAQAAPVEALKPMAFLAGHCWKGDLIEGKQSDEHCFQWVYDGQALRDVHTVRTPGKPDYVGETTYYYDSLKKEVAFLYIENFGGYSRGTAMPTASGFEFPATQYVGGGQALTYRVRWTLMGPDAYEAFSEMNIKDKWVTQFKVVLKKQ